MKFAISRHALRAVKRFLVYLSWCPRSWWWSSSGFLPAAARSWCICRVVAKWLTQKCVLSLSTGYNQDNNTILCFAITPL